MKFAKVLLLLAIWTVLAPSRAQAFVDPYFKNICIVEQNTLVDDVPDELWALLISSNWDTLSTGPQYFFDNGNGAWTQIGQMTFPNGHRSWGCVRYLEERYRGASFFGRGRLVILRDRMDPNIEIMINDDGQGHFLLFCTVANSSWLSGRAQLIASGQFAWYTGL